MTIDEEVAFVSNTLAAAMADVPNDQSSSIPLLADSLGLSECTTELVWRAMLANANGDQGLLALGCLLTGARLARAQADNLHLAA